jgi:hypothetical protein
MTGEQMRAIFKRVSWTQKDAAALLDLSERNIRRYIAGHLPIPRVVELAINWLTER